MRYHVCILQQDILMSVTDRQTLDAARSELAALQVRSEKQQNKVMRAKAYMYLPPLDSLPE